jgi:hypothetical protein
MVIQAPEQQQRRDSGVGSSLSRSPSGLNRLTQRQTRWNSLQAAQAGVPSDYNITTSVPPIQRNNGIVRKPSDLAGK